LQFLKRDETGQSGQPLGDGVAAHLGRAGIQVSDRVVPPCQLHLADHAFRRGFGNPPDLLIEGIEGKKTCAHPCRCEQRRKTPVRVRSLQHFIEISVLHATYR
jgi:hypothetical protein